MSAEWCARDTAPHAGLCSLDHGTEQRRAISKTLCVVAVAVSSGDMWIGWERAAGPNAGYQYVHHLDNLKETRSKLSPQNRFKNVFASKTHAGARRTP